jgi:3alpha(or 20beta)-hydroxysteroid dehydrogenase
MDGQSDNKDRLAGKVAVITGAARGTGAETARFFVKSGAKVVVTDIVDDRGAQVAAELGDAAYYRHLDVTSQDDWEAAIPEAESRFGRVNVLVNNAAILHLATIADTTSEIFHKVLDVNLVGPMLGIKAVTAAMRRAGGGSIVNVASVDAFDPHNGSVCYASSKWGLRCLTRVAALELGMYGIRVNVVMPSAGSNDMLMPFIGNAIRIEAMDPNADPSIIPTDRFRREEQIIDAVRFIAFLASNESASCTGADYVIDRGQTAGHIILGLPGDKPSDLPSTPRK